MSATILDVQDLAVEYVVEHGVYEAITDITFEVRAGEIVGIVGESGCGKSTLMASLLQLLPPNGRVSAGSVALGGRDITRCSPEAMRRIRGAELAMIFQDPLTSLNPVFRIGRLMLDAQLAHAGGNGKTPSRGELRRRAIAALTEVGIADAEERLESYPHQLSGGMRQRVMIATALLLEPAVLVADEATSALDVTLEAQILELLQRLRETHGTAILFVSHDLGVVSQICDRIAVMYAGRIVEENDVVSIFERPQHPYTQALLKSVPSFKQRGKPLAGIPGRVPSLAALPHGCKFANRCPSARIACSAAEPPLLSREGGRVRCAIYDPTSGYHDEVD